MLKLMISHNRRDASPTRSNSEVEARVMQMAAMRYQLAL
jgi:hypothetical protein